MYELMSAISIAVLLWIILVPYNDFRVDRLRQQLFELRDDLFDRAAKGEIRFESPAYRATRAVINGMIRFSHRLSLARMATLVAFRVHAGKKGYAHEPKDGLYAAMAASRSEDRAISGEYMLKAHVLVVRHVLSSPIALVFVVPFLCLVFLKNVGIDVAAKVVQVCGRPIAELDRLAFREGQQC